jgi:hypothetical protein
MCAALMVSVLEFLNSSGYICDVGGPFSNFEGKHHKLEQGIISCNVVSFRFMKMTVPRNTTFSKMSSLFRELTKLVAHPLCENFAKLNFAGYPIYRERFFIFFVFLAWSVNILK